MGGFKNGFSTNSYVGPCNGGYRGGFSIQPRGSVEFNGSSDFLLVANGTNFAPGTGDFTVEWWQYMDTLPTFVRSFSIGVYNSATLAVSFEAGAVLFWHMGGFSSMGTHGTLTSAWKHIALVRSSGTAKVYINGSNISGAGVADSTNITYNAAHLFAIGTETANGLTGSVNTLFDGKITNFNFVKGTALYSSNFTPGMPISAHANSKLLLLVNNPGNMLVDSSGQATTITSVGAPSWNNATP